MTSVMAVRSTVESPIESTFIHAASLPYNLRSTSQNPNAASLTPAQRMPRLRARLRHGCLLGQGPQAYAIFASALASWEKLDDAIGSILSPTFEARQARQKV